MRSRDLPDDEPAHADFHDRLADLARAVTVDRLGLPELATTAEQRRGEWAHDPAHVCEAALAVDAGGRDLGAWVVSLPVRENLDAADVEILDPPQGGRTDDEADALHAALLADALATVRRHGREVVFTREVPGELVGESLDPVVLARHSEETVGPSPRFSLVHGLPSAAAVPVRSGFGAVPRSDRSVRRMTAAGYVPVQLERISVLDLTDPPVRDDTGARRDPSSAGGAEGPTRSAGDPTAVRAVSWVDDTPDEWAAQIADLHTVFEATVPTGGAGLEPEVWDVTRLREAEEAARAVGVVRIVSAIAEGDRLLAFTLFEQMPGSPLVFQEHTVVRPEARGSGLAAAVKRANAAHLRAVSPDAGIVCTWNAVENGAMLAVNAKAGFRPFAFTILWELRLTT